MNRNYCVLKSASLTLTLLVVKSAADKTVPWHGICQNHQVRSRNELSPALAQYFNEERKSALLRFSIKCSVKDLRTAAFPCGIRW